MELLDRMVLEELPIFKGTCRRLPVYCDQMVVFTTVCFFGGSYSDGYEVLSYCDFDLHLPFTFP